MPAPEPSADTPTASTHPARPDDSAGTSGPDLAAAGRAVAIGVFDGVHAGHRALLTRMIAEADARGLRSGVITFDPNPLEVLRPDQAPTRVSTIAQRLELLAQVGVQDVEVLTFDEALSHVSAEEFAERHIFDDFDAKTVVVGENFRFGQRARGDVAMLTDLAAARGIDVVAVPLAPVPAPVPGDEESAGSPAGSASPVSSTLVRSLVAAGDVEGAGAALLRPHRVEGVVVSGDARGTDLGYPTANLDPTPRPCLPADGVYAGYLVRHPYAAADQREVLPAAISVGTNPHFGGTERRIESFVIDAESLDLYGEQIAVDFVARLRDQATFDSVDALVEQMGRDVDQARRVLGL